MSEIDAEAIRARVEAADRGPWKDLWFVLNGRNASANFNFITHARTDVPDLLDEVERLTAWRDGLKFCPHCTGMVDHGDDGVHVARCKERVEEHDRLTAERDQLRDQVAALEVLRDALLRGGRGWLDEPDPAGAARKLADEWDMRGRP